MKYDPIQAFFDGITSSFARCFLAVFSFFGAFATLYFSQGNTDPRLLAAAPLIALGTIFAWGASGIFFIFGISSFIAFFFFAWRFLDSPQPKLLFACLYSLAFIFFVPLMWDHDFVIWKGVLCGIAVLVVYLSIAFGLPALASLFIKRNSTEQDAAANP